MLGWTSALLVRELAVTFGKLFVMTVLAGAGAVHLWHVHERSVIDRELIAAGDSNGFVAVVTAPDTPPDTAVILAPVNCPSAQAKRADAMAAQLSQLGIAINRRNQYSAVIHNRDQMPLLTRTNQVLGGEVPIVIINGMAKANPTVDEVAAEARRGK
jgi:hypothetical protein